MFDGGVLRLCDVKEIRQNGKPRRKAKLYKQIECNISPVFHYFCTALGVSEVFFGLHLKYLLVRCYLFNKFKHGNI